MPICEGLAKRDEEAIVQSDSVMNSAEQDLEAVRGATVRFRDADLSLFCCRWMLEAYSAVAAGMHVLSKSHLGKRQVYVARAVQAR